MRSILLIAGVVLLASCSRHYTIVKVETNSRWTSRKSVWVIRSMVCDKQDKQHNK